ncbi:MAG: cation-translocating P-type ATPase [Drouetiella hepatica Uher 2000/2452]|jgi:Ca2+-transporting ATPase|uniref:Cation-translocating P-type ATPase n=1 Tax=Drouetiella hepatica Uher 2000/2452 TaxID=904376 RepID=A0A951UNP6_9CYAN|nr:cation-translocating P-type ATPase [Drouetiella hepatica Uher 2000/2452]
MSDWYQLEASQVVQQLGTDSVGGLSTDEANQRLSQQGANELTAQPPKSPWLMLWEQLIATTVVVLIVAAVVSALLGDLQDAVAIMAIVVFNAILGFTQEYQAGQEFAALKKMAMPKARVCRSHEWQSLEARDLVVGDLIQIEDGDQIPADGRLLESINLRTQESAFTGEAVAIEKSAEILSGEELPLGDRYNMVFMGTIATYGRGKAIITETGMGTELGKIADSMQSVEQQQTPLQKRLDQLGKRLALAAIALVAIIFAFGLLRGENFNDMFLTAVSLAVAVIPEGLPAVVTIALAIGARRMLKRQALIRKLPAVETLGSVTTICSDKTGTLTENRMTVTILALAGHQVDLKESFAQVTSLMDGRESTIQPGSGSELDSPIALTLVGSALCNNAMLAGDAGAESQEDGASRAIGDPTEIALVVAADRMGLEKSALEQLFPRVAEVPFDSDRKRMSTVHRFSDVKGSQSPLKEQLGNFSELPVSAYIVFTKGAVDGLLQQSSQVWTGNRTEPLDASWEKRIREANDKLAASGTRVLGVAFRLLQELPEKGAQGAIEQELTYVGLVGMLDPARPEAKQSVQTCAEAGIRTVMITGDHPLMAQHIAEELTISKDGKYLTGQQLSQLSPQQLEEQVESVSVYARVSPDQKLRIVEALKNRGQIVSMTGDGVNDAPALSKADIGVAMGIAGTDVAKEAADMVLLNDNFSTIVAAVEEGRVIYDNIRKFIRYSLTGNVSGVVIMLFAPLFAMPLPLQPIQILWINLLADGLLAIALSVEPAEDNVMKRPPYSPGESVFSRGIGRDIIWVGTLMGAAFLWLGYHGFTSGWQNWQTLVFVTLAFSRMSLAFAMRSDRELLMRRGFLTNKPLLIAVLTTFVLQIVVIYVPWMQEFFHTQALPLEDLAICLSLSTIGFWAVEFQKFFRQRRN